MYAEIAEAQAVLEGISLPAEKRQLIEYARRQSGGSGVVSLLARLPAGSYDSLDAVGEALAPVQPRSAEEAVALARDESGAPPGGKAYLEGDRETGAVRPSAPRSNPPKQAIEQQTKLQKKQQQRQQQMLGEEQG